MKGNGRILARWREKLIQRPRQLGVLEGYLERRADVIRAPIDAERQMQAAGEGPDVLLQVPAEEEV